MTLFILSLTLDFLALWSGLYTKILIRLGFTASDGFLDNCAFYRPSVWIEELNVCIGR